MERIARLHIEKLPEGVFLATSDDVQGLVAQGRTITETLEIARDVARKLIEAYGGDPDAVALPAVGDSLDYPLVIAAE
jgi:predicted RNase H-like HicB family nuclease